MTLSIHQSILTQSNEKSVYLVAGTESALLYIMRVSTDNCTLEHYVREKLQMEIILPAGVKVCGILVHEEMSSIAIEDEMILLVVKNGEIVKCLKKETNLEFSVVEDPDIVAVHVPYTVRSNANHLVWNKQLIRLPGKIVDLDGVDIENGQRYSMQDVILNYKAIVKKKKSAKQVLEDDWGNANDLNYRTDIYGVDHVKVLEFEVLDCMDAQENIGPCWQEKAQEDLSNVKWHTSALVLCSSKNSIQHVIQQATTCIANQIQRMQLQKSKVQHTRHFSIPGQTYPITQIVDSTISSTDLKDKLHDWFMAPKTFPCFEPNSYIDFQQPKTDILRDVHLGVPQSPVVNGTQYLVKGSYEYYHYMQQDINDKGWGCAYRSLQTLCSFFQLNHLTNQPPPTHKAIQQTLVHIGDKPSSFIGSKEWIGSVEVGYYLDEQLNITCKAMMVPKGPELATKASELKSHFQTQGTPIMIGGGQLALTLLGIDYNPSTNDIAFLILDPHYIGKEDLRIIQRKTLNLEGSKAVPCGWRRASSFSKNSFYNLCMPQLPNISQS